MTAGALCRAVLRGGALAIHLSVACCISLIFDVEECAAMLSSVKCVAMTMVGKPQQRQVQA
jgi:hypothetical protein